MHNIYWRIQFPCHRIFFKHIRTTRLFFSSWVSLTKIVSWVGCFESLNVNYTKQKKQRENFSPILLVLFFSLRPNQQKKKAHKSKKWESNILRCYLWLVCMVVRYKWKHPLTLISHAITTWELDFTPSSFVCQLFTYCFFLKWCSLRVIKNISD